MYVFIIYMSIVSSSIPLLLLLVIIIIMIVIKGPARRRAGTDCLGDPHTHQIKAGGWKPSVLKPWAILHMA